MNQKVIDFLKYREHKICVLATASKQAQPESAVVGYAVRDDGKILVSTKNDTRKWKNIAENNMVALVVGFGFDELNVQYEGKAHKLEGELSKEAETFFYTQNPSAAKFKSDNTLFIEITPTWVRLLDPTFPLQVEEETLV